MTERKASMGDKVYRGDVVKFIRNNISLGTFMKRTVKTADEACWDLCDKLNYVPAIEESNEPHWIPVTERLPKDSQFVLITIRRMDEHYNHEPFRSLGYISWNQSAWWCVHDGDCKLHDVRVDAWMPLPEPYKDDPCNGCDYLGESCVGEGCGKLTERKEGEADD